MITVPHIELLVAEIDRELIGSGYARIERSKPYFQYAWHTYLGFMYVVPEHRGKGISKKIRLMFPIYWALYLTFGKL